MDENLERCEQLLTELFEYIEKSIHEILGDFLSWWNEFYDSLEPYERFEMQHPRKKPRGSMRRERRKRKHEQIR